MKIFDTHCHPQSPQYDHDREEVIRRALDAGVFMICVGTDLKTSKKAITLAQQYDGIWASVGLHPNDNLDEKYEQGEYKKLMAEKKVVAVGEVGLDYYRTTDLDKKKFQRERFEKQIQLADEFKKPLIIHCRDAHKDMIEILMAHQTQLNGGVIHSFTGTYEDAKKYLQLGFFLGFNGIISFTGSYDETVKIASLNQILLETDAPYLAPEPFRGKRNEPIHVKEVAEHVARLKGTVISEIFNHTTENALKLFRIEL
ncbi:MAG TPA: TatD family hydrolase [Candidatus Paceibacterota bacterium]|nr:TatD family hydrolase [Candidatus Paceibacterota bacterium]